MSKPSSKEETPPPFLGSWNQVYTLVLVLHALIIILFYWFSVANR